MAENWAVGYESEMAEYEAEAEYIPDGDEVVICRECGIGVIDGTICEGCGTPTDSWIAANEDDCPLDGDAESALASCGWGTDEDYDHYDYSEW